MSILFKSAVIIGSIIAFSSCASFKYSEEESRIDRQVLLVCVNTQDYYVTTSEPTSPIIKHEPNDLFYVVPKLQSKYTNIIIFHPNYDTVQIKIKRTPRVSALTKDIALGLFSLGLPLIMDLSNPDLYQVHKKSRGHQFKLEYSQLFMQNEYNKIANTKDPKDYENWLALYPKSTFRDSVIYAKDMLELNIALNSNTEKSLEQYIFTHQQSKLFETAKSALASMQEARIEFGKTIVNNSVSSFQQYLAKYPQSIYKNEAQIRLCNLAIDEMPYRIDTNLIHHFFSDFFHPVITSSNSDFKIKSELSNKFINKIENILARKYLSFSCEDRYNCLSKLWNDYKLVERIYNRQIAKYSSKESFADFGLLGRKYHADIYKIIFDKMKLNNSRIDQNILISNLKNDFKFLIPEGDYSYFFYVLIKSVKEKNGLIKIWDVKYISHSISEADLLSSYLFNNGEFWHADYWDDSFINLAQIESVDQEFIFFQNNIITGSNKLYEKNNLKLSFDVGNDGILQKISFYSNGLLKSERHFYSKNSKVVYYVYEYENGKNKTEINYNNAIAKANHLNSLKKYEESLIFLKELRDNTFPNESIINQNIDLKISETKFKLDELTKKKRDTERQQEILEYESRPYCRCEWCGATYRSIKNNPIDFIGSLGMAKWVCETYCSPKCKYEAENKL